MMSPRWKYFERLFLSLSLLLFTLAQSWAEEEVNCSEEVFCIVTEQHDGFVDVFGRNLQAYDVTVTLELTLTNMVPSVETPYTKVIKGGQRKKLLLTIHQQDRNQAWKYYYHYYWSKGNYLARHDHSYLYRLPYETGQSYRVGQSYNGSFSHQGQNEIDFSLPMNTPVLAAREGVVVGVKEDSNENGTTEEFSSKGNYVYIRHSDNTIGVYIHLRHQGVQVDLGDQVQRGQLLGFSGNTGYSSGPHLHFAVNSANSGYEQISFPVTFDTAEGVKAMLIEGQFYTAK